MVLGFIAFLWQEWKALDNHLRDLNESSQFQIIGQKHIQPIINALIYFNLFS